MTFLTRPRSRPIIYLCYRRPRTDAQSNIDPISTESIGQQKDQRFACEEIQDSRTSREEQEQMTAVTWGNWFRDSACDLGSASLLH